MGFHALLSASSASRWSVCPVSVNGTIDSKTKAAAEGTVLHGVAEDLLDGKPEPAVGSVREADGFKFEITDDMMSDVRAYVRYVRELPWEGGYRIESKLTYGKFLAAPRELAWGTGDCWGFVKHPGSHGRALKIIDLKMGRRAVGVERNKQMALYAAGALDRMTEMPLPRDFPVELTIYQPRISYRPFVWETTVGWVEDITAEMRPAAAAAIEYAKGAPSAQTLQDFPELVGDHCTFCRRHDQCREFQNRAKSIGVEGKTVEWNAQIFAMRHAIRGYLDELEEYAFDEAERGNLLPGTKLVKGRAGKAELAVGQDEIRAKARALGIEARVVKTEEVWATPAKIRDALKAAGVSPAEIAKYITQPEGANQITDINDPRPAVQTTVGNQFTGQEFML